MLLCVFRSLEEVKSSNHVHITVVHNVPARKNFIFGVYILHYNEFLTDGDNLGSGAACVTRTSPGLKNNSLIFYPFCKQVEDRNLFNNALFCLKKVLISFGVLISKIQRNVKVLLRRNNIWEIETFQDVRAHFASSLLGPVWVQKNKFLDNCDNNMEKHITRKHKQKFKQEHNYAHEMILTIMTQTEAGWRCPSSASWPCQSSRLPPTLLLALG